MKILVIGATGMIGSRVVAGALGRGHQVTAASRSGSADDLPAGATAVVLDASTPAAVAEHATGHDAVVSALSPPRDGTDPAPALLTAYRSVIEGVRTAGLRRLVVVGGAGSLRTASGRDRVDEPDFPSVYKPEALAQREVLTHFRNEVTDLDWTYVSPADEIAPQERTGAFRLGGDQLLTAADGTSFISAEDYAVALVDELEKNEAIRRRVTVAYWHRDRCSTEEEPAEVRLRQLRVGGRVDIGRRHDVGDRGSCHLLGMVQAHAVDHRAGRSPGALRHPSAGANSSRVLPMSFIVSHPQEECSLAIPP